MSVGSSALPYLTMMKKLACVLQHSYQPLEGHIGVTSGGLRNTLHKLRLKKNTYLCTHMLTEI